MEPQEISELGYPLTAKAILGAKVAFKTLLESNDRGNIDFVLIGDFMALEDENESLREQLAECRQTIEDVAIGQALECPTCGKFRPCCCDKGES